MFSFCVPMSTESLIREGPCALFDQNRKEPGGKCLASPSSEQREIQKQGRWRHRQEYGWRGRRWCLRVADLGGRPAWQTWEKQLVRISLAVRSKPWAPSPGAFPRGGQPARRGFLSSLRERTFNLGKWACTSIGIWNFWPRNEVGSQFLWNC